jgi:hypothetical protein
MTENQQTTQHQAIPDEWRGILASARKTKLTKAGVATVAELIQGFGTDVRSLIKAALEEKDGHTATVLMVGATMNGYRPETDELFSLLPYLGSMDLIGPLIGLCSGDRLKMLLESLESGRLSWERQAYIILISVLLLGNSPPPPSLLTQIRLSARLNLGPESGCILGLAAQRIADPATRLIAAPWIELASFPVAAKIIDKVQNSMGTMPAELLSETDEDRFQGAVVLRRTAPKVGRNDPCPCGSGHKYKKCCAEKDEARLADPSPVAGVTMSEYIERPESYLDLEQLSHLSVREIARLDYSQLNTLCAIAALRKLSLYRFWDEAESAMAELETRKNFPLDCAADDYRDELMQEAISAGAWEVFSRQASKIQDPQILNDFRMELDLHNLNPEIMSRLEKEVFENLQNSQHGGIIDLAYASLDQYPALGILFARAALDPTRSLDMEILLEEVERARDRLQLPPGDIAQDLYERLIDQDLSSWNEKDINSDAEMERLNSIAAEQRAHLKASSAKVAELEKRLGTQEKLLKQYKAENERIPKVKPLHSAPLESEDVKKLRNKIAELKGLISEGHKERSTLRIQLSEAAFRVEKAVLEKERKHGSTTDSDISFDGEELDATAPGRLTTLIPAFKNKAGDAIRNAPKHLARQALQTVAGLAAGDNSLWSSCKKLRSIPDVWSARIGIHYRLLFRFDSARTSLDISAFIHRRDLESTIAQSGI